MTTLKNWFRKEHFCIVAFNAIVWAFVEKNKKLLCNHAFSSFSLANSHITNHQICYFFYLFNLPFLSSQPPKRRMVWGDARHTKNTHSLALSKQRRKGKEKKERAVSKRLALTCLPQYQSFLSFSFIIVSHQFFSHMAQCMFVGVSSFSLTYSLSLSYRQKDSFRYLVKEKSFRFWFFIINYSRLWNLVFGNIYFSRRILVKNETIYLRIYAKRN